MNTKNLEKILEYSKISKVCNICNELKSPEELATRGYYKNTEIRRTYNTCKKCDNKKRNERLKRNPSLERNKRRYNSHKNRVNSNPEKYRNLRLLRIYNVDNAWFKENLIKQNYKCDICECIIDENTCKVDHNHDTDKVRGLLCHHCNTGIGFLKENVNSLKKAILYLEKHSE